MHPLRLVILGRQGSGKGTQCANLVAHYGTVHVSTGDMLRAAVAARSELGREAEAIMHAGGLVGDEIMNGIVAERLAEPDIVEHGFLLDGFPRTPAQADALERILGDDHLDVAINLEVAVAEVTARMMSRGRHDDTLEAITRRLELYERETAPLLEWFEQRGLLETVDGVGTESEVFDRLTKVIDLARA